MLLSGESIVGQPITVSRFTRGLTSSYGDTHLVEDNGLLAVTDQRVIYAGILEVVKTQFQYRLETISDVRYKKSLFSQSLTFVTPKGEEMVSPKWADRKVFARFATTLSTAVERAHSTPPAG